MVGWWPLIGLVDSSYDGDQIGKQNRWTRLSLVVDPPVVFYLIHT